MMKKIFSLMICLTLTGNLCAKTVNWENRMWYSKPAAWWLEALPIGNSRMGAMVYGGTDKEEIQLNEETFWSGGPHNNNSTTSLQHLQEVRDLIFQGKEKEAEGVINREFIKGPHGMRFLPAGSLIINLNHENVTDYCRELNLDQATAVTAYTCDGVRFTRTAIASMEDNVVVVNIKADKKGKLNFSLNYKSQLPCQVNTVDNQLVAWVEGVEQEGIPAALKAQTITKVVTDGKLSAQTESLTVDNASEATLLISTATNFVNYHDVSGNQQAKNDAYIKNAEKYNFKQLLKRHIDKFQQQYNRVHIRLSAYPESNAGKLSANEKLPTNERLSKFYGSDDMGMVELLFNFGRYLLISSSQPGGQPANLQGVWNDKRNAPWDSKYTININAEMNYWPAEVCNISETAQPLFQMIKELSETGAETAKVMYDCKGWVAHHNTDLWRIAGPIDGAPWGMFPNGGAWLCTHIWEHYQFTLDKDFLRVYYPVLKGASDFYLDYMVEKDGELLVVPSVSPEHGGRGKATPVCAACTMDNQIARDILSQTLESAKILNLDADYQQKLKTAIAKLPPMKVGQYGQLQEWREDLDDPNDQHRHISHLYGLHPSNQISPYTTPELWNAARVTLEQRGDQATGWSLGWKTNFWARMLDGNHAFKIISNMLRILPNEGMERQYPDGRTFPNLFDAHPPFQIDGNFGVTAGIAEMLLQSQDGFVHLLPALPDKWNSGEVQGLKARGGFEVSISWNNNRLTSAEIKPAADGVLKLRCADQIKAKNSKLIASHDGVYDYEINVKKGKVVSVQRQ